MIEDMSPILMVENAPNAFFVVLVLPVSGEFDLWVGMLSISTHNAGVMDDK